MIALPAKALPDLLFAASKSSWPPRIASRRMSIRVSPMPAANRSWRFFVILQHLSSATL
jgi:hypothetical protein